MSKHLSPAYQLYSAREDASNDLEGVLDQLSRMGYEGVEFAGFFEKTAKEVRKMLKHTGLKAVSSHVPLQQIRDDMQSVLDYHEELECGCIAVPYLAEEDRPGQPGFARVLETLYTFGRQCKKRGIVLLYHNHDFEFAQISGMTALDFLYAAVPASVLKCELDTCWIRYAGADPADYLRRYAERCPVVHLKDYVGDPGGPAPYALLGQDAPAREDGGQPFLFKPLGGGCQDIPALVEAAREAGTRWLVVEQDESPERPALEDARLSAEHLLPLL